MKHLVLIGSVLLFSGCKEAATIAGGEACASSPLVGKWDARDSEDVMTFTSSCTGSSVGCSSQFTYPNTSNLEGQAKVVVSATNGANGCLSAGDHVCEYIISDDTLGFQCDGGGIYILDKVN